MGHEIERKFRVAHLPPSVEGAPARVIDQGYLAIGPTSEVRLRRVDSRRLLTVKRGHGEDRLEVEVELEGDQFTALWPLTEGRRIRKRRHVVEGSPTVEVDVYLDDLAGLIVAEVEFGSMEAADAFEPLEWMDEELTGDERYANQQLAVHGLPSAD